MPHPGPHIRNLVIPKKMTITEAARLLGVGRPALSNMLNGNSALSPDMASRIARAFGASSRELMDMQAAHDARVARERGDATSVTRTYVPPFLQITAADIEGWSSRLLARSRLAVLLRILVHSTGHRITSADFPGNDDAERAGWDGFVDAGEATPWIPQGPSGWEFGVNSDVKRKADADYAKSVRQVPEPERADTTFVFVTPRRWHAKKSWAAQRRAENRWKDIRVYDASDIEQWLEQSIPAQAWLANEIGRDADGVLSLDDCWRDWSAVCQPQPIRALFSESVDPAIKAIREKLAQYRAPIIVKGDSVDEALAFLSCAFDSPELYEWRDRVVVFRKAGVLRRLASKHTHFLPVLTSREIEKEYAPLRDYLAAFIVYPRNVANIEADVTIEPLSDSAFDSGLRAMGFDRDEIDRLSRESGRSLTVLRRRLSTINAIQTPEWASVAEHSMSLLPFVIAGAWNAQNPADQAVLSLLAGVSDYEPLETRLGRLLQLDDAPVWSVGAARGVVSKIDSLFAIAKWIQHSDIERFLSVARLVLSEDDPAMDLPEDERWMAGARGKKREISASLRDGIGETLVLLVVHGPVLFQGRLAFDFERQAKSLIQALLLPLTARKLEADARDLPVYAEAAPVAFLDMVERDLASADPESLKLMRSSNSGIFGRCPRSGLLWALENIAWSPEHLSRVVDILARLSKPVIDDNWTNRPAASLSAIFLNWMPQTAADLEQRKAAMDHLIARYPDLAWTLCTEQFNGRTTVGHFSHKPRWRPSGHGFGGPVPAVEARAFSDWVVERAISWKEHTRQTLRDLVVNASRMSDRQQNEVWDLVAAWSTTASDGDRAWLREEMRVGVVMRARPKRRDRIEPAQQLASRARETFDLLEPNEIVHRYAWLFRNGWLEHSADEISGAAPEFARREAKIAEMRADALRKLFEVRGIDGVVELASLGNAAYAVGFCLPGALPNIKEQIAAVRGLLIVPQCDAQEKFKTRQAIVAGCLANLPTQQLGYALAVLCERRAQDDAVELLRLAPFGRETWAVVDALGGEVADAYWRRAEPGWGRGPAEEVTLAINHLLDVGRPRAAFRYAEPELENLQPQLLFKLMKAVATIHSEEPGTYRLQPRRIVETLSLLNNSGEVPGDEMAELEFRFLDALGGDGGAIPNLERQIEEHPELFVQAIAFAFRRRDDGIDPEHLRADSPESGEHRALAAYKLLDRLSRIPGHNREGHLSSDHLTAWIRQVRDACRTLGRQEICDHRIGLLLAKAPVGMDGIWPVETVRPIIEEHGTEELLEGIFSGRYNSRGIHWRGEGGAEERELSAQYLRWSGATAIQYPSLSRVLRDLARVYEKEADREDMDAVVRKRLRH